jgi:hypothetical protein
LWAAEKLLKGHVIANPVTGLAIREIKPTPPERAGTLGPLQPLSITGVIRLIRRNPRGEIDGTILDNGTLLHFPPQRIKRVIPCDLTKATLGN